VPSKAEGIFFGGEYGEREQFSGKDEKREEQLGASFAPVATKHTDA